MNANEAAMSLTTKFACSIRTMGLFSLFGFGGGQPYWDA